MSLDAGGLAQMTYQNNNGFGGHLGMPTSSFASRGKGTQLKRLSLSPVGENHPESSPAPRTSRGHLLAGLRTAPKGQNGPIPASAPYNKTQHRPAQENSYGQQHNGYGGMPQTAIGNSFGLNSPQQYNMPEQQYSMSQHVLAPPTLQFDHEDEQMDPNVLAQLLQTEAYLAQRQRMLQQQLMSISQQQFQGMNLNGQQFGMAQQYPQTPMSPQYGGHMNGMGMNNQGPIIQEVPNQPGLLMIINPQTREVNYMMDPSFQQQQQQQSQLANSPPPPTPSYTNSPPRGPTPGLMPENPTPSNDRWSQSRSVSPPKKTSSPPQDVEPLPPPSANAFRRGHKFNKSIATDGNPGTPNGPKSALRTGGLPNTPMTGTFGPGQNRAGEHPVRQPRGPPSIEELVAKPTSKHEGSKNFATRQRRRAVHSLVRAGIERRGVRSGSGGSMSPVSETDGYPMMSDNDSESVRSSSSLSNKNSIGSLRAKASGVIGSERRAKKEGSVDSLSSSSSSASKMEIRIEEPPKTSTPGSDRIKTPMLVLTSAEKRKTWVS